MRVYKGGTGRGRFETRPKRAGGAAVIMAMLTVALVAGLAATLLRHYGASVEQVAGRHEQAQARWLARAAVDWGRQVLAEDARTGGVDHLGESWALRIPPTPVEDGEVGGELEEQDGRFNLNNLVSDGRADPAQVRVFSRLLGHLGLPATLAEALVDWLDADSQPAGPGGGEGEWYAAQSPPRVPLNAPLVTVEEIAAVRGFAPAVVERLRPFVTVLPAATRVNVNTASGEVLAALIPDLHLDGARQVVAERARAHFRSEADFLARLPRSGLQADAGLLAVRSRFFIATARARYGQAVSRLQALLDRQNAWPEIVWQRML